MSLPCKKTLATRRSERVSIGRRRQPVGWTCGDCFWAVLTLDFAGTWGAEGRASLSVGNVNGVDSSVVGGLEAPFFGGR